MTTALPPLSSNALSASFRWLALTTAIATFILIVFGGSVRVTTEGLGCELEWPLCQGQLLPPLTPNNFAEVLHRMMAVVVAGAMGLTTVVAWRSYRQVRWIIGPTLVSAGLLVMQILLGAITARSAQASGIVVLHLALGLGMLALQVIVTVTAFQLQRNPRLGNSLLHFDSLSRWVGATTLCVFGLIILGAIVTATQARTACLDWPLCNGNLLPTTPLAWLAMLHRYAALAVGLLILSAVWQAWQVRRHNVPVAVSAAVTGALFISQILVSAQNVLMGFPAFLNGLHLALATAVWASMVAFAVLAFQYVRLSPLRFTAPVSDLVLAPVYIRAFARHVGDYFALTKPIIMLLLLATTWAAMIVAGHGWPPADLMFWTLVGGALASGGASALNQVIDRNLDQAMARTARRPLAAGRVDLAGGLAFGLVLSIFSFVLLATFVNFLAAYIALLGNLYYVVAYSLWLKKSSVQNIVIGGGAGAMPPLVGWAAVTGRLDIAALFLFAIIFFWTPPHFWALALLKKNDYARAQVPMLPVVWGEADTRRHIFGYTLVLVALSLLLPPAQIAGWFYLIAASVLGLGFIFYATWLLRGGNNKVAWGLYKYSSLYLALLFAALVVDRLVA